MYGNGIQSMFGASRFQRFLAAVSALALAVISAPLAAAGTIDLSLNVFFATPSDVNSGGTWQLIAKSTDFGIAGVRTFITGVNDAPAATQLVAPRGTYSGGAAGFGDVLINDLHAANGTTPSFHELIFGQVPRPNGSAQGTFYGVGTLIKGSPDFPGRQPDWNFIGPAIPTLTATQGLPWAPNGDAFGNATWNTAALLASGTFAAGATPSFFTGDEASSGQIFSVVGTGTSPGTATPATISAIVRTNFVHSADYNNNGRVDAADYVMWRKTLGNTVTPGSGADGFVDGTINDLDYFWWRSHFGLTDGAAPGLGSELSAGAVPEPASPAVFVVAALLAVAPRGRRKLSAMNG